MAEARAPHVVVIGGGITGLAAAWYLRSGATAAPPAVTVLEAGDRLGGKISTGQLGGVAVEDGPDTFLARVPWAADLCRSVGLGDDLVAPATGKAYIWVGGEMRRIPRHQVLGVPTALWPLRKSGIVSGAGLARASLDLVLPRQTRGADPSVAEVVGERFGSEVVERLVDPLVGGINAGRASELSAKSTAAPVAAAARRHRSLLLGLRKDRRSAPPPSQDPLFLGVAGGMQRLVDALHSHLRQAGVDVRLGAPAGPVEPSGDGRWRVPLDGAEPLDADAVVVTVPAFAAAALLKAAASAASEQIAGIRYASVVVATLAYTPPATPSYLDGSGFLVPRTEGRLTTACTWTTSKWPELRRGGHILVRCSAGRAGDDSALDLDDGQLVERFHAEMVEAVKVAERPVASSVTRWPQSFPQYEVGHERRVTAAHAALREAPGIFLAGAAYRGLGIAACIHQAEQAAGQVLTHLAHHRTATG